MILCCLCSIEAVLRTLGDDLLLPQGEARGEQEVSLCPQGKPESALLCSLDVMPWGDTRNFHLFTFLYISLSIHYCTYGN